MYLGNDSVDPCFGEEIFPALDAAAEFDGSDIRQLATFGSGRDLEGDAPACFRHGLDGDTLDLDFFAVRSHALDHRRERDVALLVEGVPGEFDGDGALLRLPVMDAGAGGDDVAVRL